MLMASPSFTTCKLLFQVFAVISNLLLLCYLIILTVATFYSCVIQICSFCPNRTACVNADEWRNFLERMFPDVDYNHLGQYTDADIPDADILQLRLWASYRGQTLARTGG